MACALAATLVVAGGGRTEHGPDGRLVLQPAADRGPDPFTPSTAAAPAARPPATTTAAATAGRAAPSGGTTAVTYTGDTPGLYGGTARAGSCDVERQIRRLTSDPARARAFAGAEGITPAAIPGYLRGLTSVVLRADTRVTDHGYRDGHATAFQSVLQAGTAVLVDDRGVPRVRCACGNPLARPTAGSGDAADTLTSASASASASGAADTGTAWAGYRPGRVVVVTPAARPVTGITFVDGAGHGWVRRPVGHGAALDHAVPPAREPFGSRPPDGVAPSAPSARPSGAVPARSPSPAPSRSARPRPKPSGCATPTPTPEPTLTLSIVPEPEATMVASASGTPCPSPTPTDPFGVLPTDPPVPLATMVNRPQRAAPSAPATPAPTATGAAGDGAGSIFDSPTDVFGG
ncbi:DUF6777 domain-containing protein [Streptomyces mangrovisoli]|nr:DUF6777 domain-containing protein [Streptomyces mangrovisoli]